MKTSIVVTGLIASAAFAQDIPISDPALRPAFGNQTSVAVAASGGDYLATWADARAHIYSTNTFPNPHEEWDIYTSRIGLDGTVDPLGGVLVSPTSSRDDSPAVIWNGSEYVVVNTVQQWLLSVPSGVMFSRVTDEGPQPGTLIPLGPEIVARYGARLTAAWNGREYLVVIGYEWPMIPNDIQPHIVHAFLADRDFRVVRPVLEVSGPAADSILPTVSSDGTSFLVAWNVAKAGGSEIRTAIVSSSGEVQRQPGPLAAFPVNPLAFDRWPAASVWDGQRFFVTWSDNSSISGRFVDRNGTPLGDATTIAHSDGIEVFAPSIAWNGSGFLVAFAYRNEWGGPREYPVTNVYAERLRADGSLIDQPYPLTITTAPGAQTLSAVAASGDRFIVAWESDSDIRSAIVDPITGSVTSDSLVTRSIGRQLGGRGVFDGNEFGFLWTEDDDVLFGRMSIDGRTLDGPGRKVGGGMSRALLWNGDVFLAVWSLNAVRIAPSGDVLDSEPIKLPESGDLFASDGKDFLVVTRQITQPQQIPRSHLRAYIVTGSGFVTSAVPFPAAEFSQIPVSLAWNGSHYLVVYTQYFGEICYHCFPQSEPRAILLDRQGRALGAPFPIALVGPAAGGDGKFIVTGYQWQPENNWKLLYTIIDDSGAVTPRRLITSTYPGILDVAWDGRAFVVAAGQSLYRIGSVVEERRDAIPKDTLETRLIPAHGATPLLINRIEKLAPGKHEGGIERYVLRWPHPGASRAVAHR